MFRIEFDVEDAIASFNAMADRCEDLSPVMERTEHVIADEIKTNFTAESDAHGNAWGALKNSTVADRTRLGFGGEGPILRRTGELAYYDSTALREHDHESVQVGAIDGNIRALALNDGRETSKPMVARPFLSVSDETLDEIGNDILDYIESGR